MESCWLSALTDTPNLTPPSPLPQAAIAGERERGDAARRLAVGEAVAACEREREIERKAAIEAAVAQVLRGYRGRRAKMAPARSRPDRGPAPLQTPSLPHPPTAPTPTHPQAERKASVMIARAEQTTEARGGGEAGGGGGGGGGASRPHLSSFPLSS